MAATAENPTINIDDVVTSFMTRPEFEYWSVNSREVLTAGLSRMLHSMEGQDLSNLTDETLIQAWSQEFSDRYIRNETDDERVLDWMREQIAPDKDEDVPVERKPGEFGARDLAEHLFGEFRAAELDSITGLDEAMEVIDYQFGNWRRDVRVPKDSARAYEQWSRRMSKVRPNVYQAGAMTTTARSVLDLGHAIITGREEAVRRPSPASSTVSAFLTWTVGRRGGLPSEDGYDSYYVQEALRYSIRGRTRSTERDRSPWESFMAHLRDYSTQCWEYVERYADFWKPIILEGFEYWTEDLAQASITQTEPLVIDVDDLHDWLTEQYGEIGDSLSVMSLRHGVDDFMDWVREGEAKEGDDQVEILRRMVRAYGWKKFTGKARRPVLKAALESVTEKNKDNPLTPEEWKVRWARRDLAIGYVSGRYGQEQSLCSVLEQAMGELGVPPVREPKRNVRFKSASVEVEVEVESWSTESYVLIDKAKTKWRSMSTEERKAHIVKYEPTYDLSWDSFSVDHA